MSRKKTPGRAPGMDLESIKRSVALNQTAENNNNDESIQGSEAGGLLSAVAMEIQAEKEEENLTNISARIPKEVAMRIKREALAHDLKVGVYLRKVLTHTFSAQ